MKGLLAVLAKAKPKDEDEDDEMDQSEDHKSLMVDAAEDGDWEAFVDALKSYVKSCVK